MRDPDRARRVALTAIALDQPATAPGEPPSDDELWDWMADAVEPARAVEIRAHVARDPLVRERWRQLRLALAEEALIAGSAPAISSDGSDGGDGSTVARRRWSVAAASERWRRRLATWPLGGAFATAAVIGIAIAVSLRHDVAPLDPWQDWRTPKSAAMSPLEVDERAELVAFLVGMRRGLQELALEPIGPDGQPLPSRGVPCAAADESCVARRAALETLGRLAMLARGDCVRGSDADRALRSRAAELLPTLGTDPPVMRLVPPLRDWAGALSDRAGCAAVGRLLERALLARGGADG